MLKGDYMKNYLSERENQALEALLIYRNHSEAVRECGIPLRTINNWMQNLILEMLTKEH